MNKQVKMQFLALLMSLTITFKISYWQFMVKPGFNGNELKWRWSLLVELKINRCCVRN
uniref:Uncharacterized protein n=1 Tax=Arundo donax TaxID=35708 RepID=A0A0A9I031_ARUDO